jgi:hypothetical protein
MVTDSNQIMAEYKNMRAIAVMDEPRAIAEKVLFPRKFITALTNNIWIPSPVPAMDEATQHADKLDEKQAIVTTRVIGAAADRDVAYSVVKLDICCWKAQVQLAADNNPQNAIAIIESCGFKVKHVPLYEKPVLRALKGNVPHSAKLIAKAVGKKASYEWQYSTNGTDWNNLPKSTPVANTQATGLTPATLYFFRYRGITNKVEGSWCDPMAFVCL